MFILWSNTATPTLPLAKEPSAYFIQIPAALVCYCGTLNASRHEEQYLLCFHRAMEEGCMLLFKWPQDNLFYFMQVPGTISWLPTPTVSQKLLDTYA